ncbi:MAG TPA: hypothetical protein VG326_10210, partial [Tepidisphaeraceae bacterium]|nr:hypothetical protein [Tepidisphaeraceae bacterium]
MPKLNGRIPKYCNHKASGRGYVTLDGKDHYCGPYADPSSKAEYDRLIKIWLAYGRRMDAPADEKSTLTINALITHFWEHAETYYRKPDGTVSRELEMYRLALRPLIALYGDTPVEEFGPLKLKVVRGRMVELKWCQNHINHQVSRIKSMFRWGTEEELVDGSVYHALISVKGLKRGRGEVVESEPVRPVPETYVNAIEPFVSVQVWAMIELQLLTGARPGELVKLRPMDIDTRGDVWVSQLGEHKTAHHGHSRFIRFGPQAKRIIDPYLKARAIHTYLFSPAEAEEERRKNLTKERKTPLSCGNQVGTNRKSDPRRMPNDCYTVTSYRRAIARACERAFPLPANLARARIEGCKGRRWEKWNEWKQRLGPDGWKELTEWQQEHTWHPHQLRHNAATRIRREANLAGSHASRSPEARRR